MNRAAASLTFNRKTRLPVRSAICPEHDKKTSKFIGEQIELPPSTKHYWTFRCPERGGHQFQADIPRGAPRSVEAAQEWVKQQEAVAAGLNYDAGGR